MAGRGTDIKLGPGVLWKVECQPHPEGRGHRYKLTEATTGETREVDSDSTGAAVFQPYSAKQARWRPARHRHRAHEARRIDRQLRGRCARQGDPGSSHFFISLEDDLMRLFGSDKIVKYMEKMGLEEGQELEHPLLNRSIGQAQKRVEQHNFQIRKRTLEYDDVMNKQREVIYGFRNEIIHALDVRDRLMDIMEEVVIQKVEQFTSPTTEPTEWKVRPLADWVNLNFPIGMPEGEIAKAAASGKEAPVKGSVYGSLSPAQFAVCGFISDSVARPTDQDQLREPRGAQGGTSATRFSAPLNKLWQEHLYEMDSASRYSSIGLRRNGSAPIRSSSTRPRPTKIFRGS